ncbi:MAG: hypothetical protein Q8R02_19795 [Hyphomonadaceae bacterium]|nr:hypothetical protein [Hyphomonadaceae bacterium]
MGNVRLAWLCVAACLTLAQPGPACAQLPRTVDGKPDFGGVWTTRWTTPLERMPEWKTLVISPAEGEALTRAFLARLDAANPMGVPARDLVGTLVVRGEVRSSLIVDPPDGHLPLTQEGRARRGQTQPNGVTGVDGPEQRSLTERCLMSGNGFAPFLTQPASNIRQVVQTDTHVVFFTESYNQLRIIPLDGNTGPQIPRGGSSKGSWNGDTLVVETGGFPPGDRIRNAGAGITFPISPNTRITERLSLIGPDEILYRFTIEDSALYAQGWTAETVMARSKERIFEFACHEGDYSMAGILGGARVVERKQAAGHK